MNRTKIAAPFVLLLAVLVLSFGLTGCKTEEKDDGGISLPGASVGIEGVQDYTGDFVDRADAIALYEGAMSALFSDLAEAVEATVMKKFKDQHNDNNIYYYLFTDKETAKDVEIEIDYNNINYLKTAGTYLTSNVTEGAISGRHYATVSSNRLGMKNLYTATGNKDDFKVEDSYTRSIEGNLKIAIEKGFIEAGNYKIAGCIECEYRENATDTMTYKNSTAGVFDFDQESSTYDQFSAVLSIYNTVTGKGAKFRLSSADDSYSSTAKYDSSDNTNSIGSNLEVYNKANELKYEFYPDAYSNYYFNTIKNYAKDVTNYF